VTVLAVEGRAVEGDSLAPPVLWPSSTSSVMPSSFCLREDRLEELLEGAAVCSEHAEVRAASLSSSAVVMAKVVSWGANLSVMAVKWTARRAVADVSGGPMRHWALGHTLQQARRAVGDVFDQDSAATVQ
jgi:hypothetical protein